MIKEFSTTPVGWEQVLEIASASSVRAILLDAVGTTIHPAQPVPFIYWRFGQRGGSHISEAQIRQRFREKFCREEEADEQAGYVTSEHREIQRWRRIIAAVFNDLPDTEFLFAELWEYYSQPDSWCVYPGVAEFLHAMHDHGKQVILASNFDNRLRTIVAGLPQLSGIDHLALSSELGWKKPSRQFFHTILRQWTLSAETTLAMGDDRVNDFQGARSAGLSALLIRHDEKNLSLVAKASG